MTTNGNIQLLNFKDLQESDSLELDYDYVDNDVIIIESLNEMPPSINDAMQLDDVTILLLCMQGKIQVTVNSVPCTAQACDVLLFGPKTMIENCMVSPDFHCRILALSTHTIINLLHGGNDIWNKAFYMLRKSPIIHLNEKEMQMYKAYCNLMNIKKQQPERRYYRQVMNSIIYAALYEIMASISNIPSMPTNETVTQGDLLFRRFIETLANDKVKSRSVTEYAQRLCVTPKYLSTVCKRVSGKTAFDWINQYVVQDIQNALKYSDLSVKEVAQQYDFPNLSFFGKYVKAHLGTSPTQYRKQLLKGAESEEEE